MKLNSIDLTLGQRLKDPEFRREWFRAELEGCVPELFRDLRELRGLTQAELAEKTEMKQSAVSRFEVSTEANWKLETLLRLADALDAQLTISLEPAESVLARHADERVSRVGTTVTSLLDAERTIQRSQSPNLPLSRSLIETNWFDEVSRPIQSAPMTSTGKQKGDRPWS